MTNKAPENRFWMTRQEVAAALQVSVRTVERLVRKDSLPAYKIGGQRRFLAKEVEEWIMQQRVGPD